MIAAHVSSNELAIADQFVWFSLDQAPQSARPTRGVGQGAVERHDHSAAAQGGEKGGAAIDGAGEHGGEDYEKCGVKGAFLRERPLVAEADDDQGENQNDHSAQRDLQEGQIFGLSSQTKQRADRIPKGLHSVNSSAEERQTRVWKRRLGHQTNPSVPWLAYFRKETRLLT